MDFEQKYQKDPGMNRVEVALDKTSFNIVNENSNYESKKFHRL